MRPFDPELLRREPGVRAPLAVLGALGVAGGVLAIAQAVAVAALVVATVRGHAILLPSACVLVVFALRALVSGGTERVAAWAGATVAGAVRRSALQRWLRQPVERRPAETVMLTRSTLGADAVEPYVSRYLPALITAAVVPPLSVLALLCTDWVSALVVVLTVPLLPLFAALIGAHTREQTQSRWAESDRLAGHFGDVMRGLPTLVAYQRAHHQIGVVAAVSRRHRRATVRTLRTAFLSSAALELLATLSVAIVAVAVGLRLTHGELGLQVGLTAILLAPEAYWPIRRMGQEFHAAAEGAQALEDLLMDEPAGGDTAQPTPAASGASLAARSLAYCYPGTNAPALRELDADFASGLTVVTGESGCGKSTLLELLAGVRRPGSGTVDRAGAVHYVTQTPFIAPGTLRDNLHLADDDRAAGRLPDSLSVLPDGLDTPLGDDGFGLSAGQRAVLALTRAGCSQAPIVLLDEPTAHLDEVARDEVHRLIEQLAADRIVVVASHSRELADRADTVIRLPRPPVTKDSAPQTATSAPHPDEQTGAPESVPGSTPRPLRPLWRPAPGILRAALLGALAAICGVALTATSGWLIVQASTRPPVLALLVAIVCVRAFGIGRPVLRYAERVGSHDAALGDLADRRVGLYASLIPLTPARLGRRRRADVLTAAVRDLDDEVDVQVRALVPLLGAAAAGVLAAATATVLAPPTGALVLALLAAAVGVAMLDARLERTRQRESLAARSAVAREAEVISTNVSALQAISAEKTMLARLARAQHDQITAVGRQARGRAVGVGSGTALIGLGVVAMAIVARHESSLAAPVAALLILGTLALGDLLGTVPDAVGALLRGVAARERLTRMTGHAPAVHDPAVRSGETAAAVPQLELAGATASWDGVHEHLPPTSLLVRPGEHLAVVGRNGAGKSTALALLARALDPAGGSYTADGTDVRVLPLEDTRRRIAVVDDEPHVFAGSVRANLLLAAPGSTDRAVAEALVDAGLGRWLANLPDGLDTALGAAREVSGGERTRLAIARAILSRRPVVLLDEPVAHLDEPTARTVMDDLHAATRSASVVVVTHQPTGTRGAARTVTVDRQADSPRPVTVGPW